MKSSCVIKDMDKVINKSVNSVCLIYLEIGKETSGIPKKRETVNGIEPQISNVSDLISEE